jgi:Xaa-Pro aminopeptidase
MFSLNNQRILSFKKNFWRLNLDAFLVSNPNNILYLTGFKGLSEKERESWLFITKNKTYFFTDNRYFSHSKEFINGKIILISSKNTLIENLKLIIENEKIKVCGIEADDLKINEFNTLKTKIAKLIFKPTERIIINQRATKEKEEVKKIEKACQIIDQCLRTITKIIKEGTTEKEIAFRMEFFLKEKGYDLAFSPIIAFDENSAVPHYHTQNGNNKKINQKGIILIDFGVKFKDYCSDITRVFFLGKPNNEVFNVYQKLLTTQTKTISFCQNNIESKAVDNFCRRNLKNNLPSLESYFYSHATGHGVGLEIHEYPKISPLSQDRLLNNQIFTIEPGIYIPKRYGLRIEDTVIIENNKPQILTTFTKKITIL